jgi:Uma2 family endonuclease
MSHTLIAPEYELFPNRYRWTVTECYRMAEEGRLVGRYEILDGEVVSKMGQKPPHYLGISLLAHWVNRTFGDPFVRVQAPITLPAPDGDYSEPEPDVAVTHEPTTAYAGHHPGPEDLLLVAEVSDTTLRTDLIVKARLYARAGIAEYWTLDLNARQLYIHRDPANGEYAVVTVHAETETVTLAARPDAPIAIADLLPPTIA